jgi:carboxymethylenebutenolidase
VAKSRVGVLGFGLGGSLEWSLLATNSDLKAGVTLYGAIPPLAAVPSIKGAVLAIFAETDQQDAADVNSLDQSMKKTGVPWAFKTEPKTGRGFFDDSRNRYVADAAKDAWKMTLDWFGKHLT